MYECMYHQNIYTLSCIYLQRDLSRSFFEVTFLAQLHRGQLDESQGLRHMVAGGRSGIQEGT